jgi:hypothetical protein
MLNCHRVAFERENCIVSIKGRIQKIEKKIKSGADRGHWSLIGAKAAAESERCRIPLIEISNRQIEKTEGEVRKHKPRVQSKADQENYVKYLVAKYSSLEGYERRGPTPIKGGKALNEIIQRYKDKRFSGS